MQEYQAIIQQAIQNSQQGHHAEALQVLKELMDNTDLPQEVLLQILTHGATISKASRDLKNQLHWVDRGIDLFPSSPLFLKWKADHYFETASYAESITWLDKLIAIRKNNKWDFLQRGHCHRFLQAYDLAEIDYLEVIAIDPAFFPAHITYTQIANDKKDYALYAQRGEQLVLDFPSELQSHTNLAYAYILAKAYDHAIRTYQNALLHHPDEPQLLYGLANTYTQNNQDLEAREAYLNALPVLSDPQQILHVGNRLITYNELEAVKKVIAKLADLHPDSEGYYLLQGQYYAKTQDYVTGLQALDKLPPNLADHVQLNIYKVNFLQARLQHSQAYEAILKLKTRHPDNTAILLLLAKHYQQVHNYQEAIKIYEHQKETLLPYPYLFYVDTVYQSGDQAKVKQKLTEYKEVKKYEPNAYYHTLVVKNKLALGEPIVDLYSDIITGHLTPELISIYSMGLQNTKETRIGKQFLEEVSNIQDLPSQQKIVASFEQLRIKNTTEISHTNNLDRILTHTAQCYADVDDIANKSTARVKTWYTLQEDLLSKIKNNFPSVHLSTKVNPIDAISIAQKVVHAIREKQPLSLIRLGDGEGNFFDYPDDLNRYQEEDQTLIQRIWWGDANVGEDKEMIQKRFFSAIDNADIIGVSDTVRLLTAFDLQNKHIIYPYLRASRAVTVINAYLAHQNTDWARDKVITSCFIHQDLQSWNLYRYIFKHVDSCSIITCHTQASMYLKQEFGVDVRSTHIIPSEHRWSSKMNLTSEDEHYPDVYRSLRESIKVARPGELYLVAAGFLGKEYCDIIKRQGGIALDVGSILDYWFRFETRAFFYVSEGNFDIETLAAKMETDRT